MSSIKESLILYGERLKNHEYGKARELAEDLIDKWVIKDKREQEKLYYRNAFVALEGNVGTRSGWRILGEVFYGVDAYDVARACFEEGLKDASDDDETARLVWALGNCQFMEQDYDGAEDNYKRSLSIFRKTGYLRGIAECLTELSYVSGVLRARDTIAYCREAIDLNIKLKRNNSVLRNAGALWNLVMNWEMVDGIIKGEVVDALRTIEAYGVHESAELAKSALAKIT